MEQKSERFSNLKKQWIEIFKNSPADVEFATNIFNSILNRKIHEKFDLDKLAELSATNQIEMEKL